jgi:hypothetical protein
MENQKISGEPAWLIMALGILTYDLIAIKTKRVETMSTALWRSLNHPVKSPIAILAWGILTHHLFASSIARSSLKKLYFASKESLS